MNKRILLSFVILGLLFGVAAGDILAIIYDVPKSYDVALVKLAESHPVTLANGTAAAYEQAYLVRLFGDFQSGRAINQRWYIGDELIEEYGGFPRGIYFFIYTKERLDRLSGQKIRFRIDNDSFTDTDLTFQPERFAPFTLMPEREAMLRPPAQPN